MPLSCCSEARFIASLISLASVLREATILRSITETFGTGTRIATPSSLPCSSGSTRPIAGVGMDRGHEAGLDADSIVQDFCDRREAVRRARTVGNHQMILGQLVVV